MRMRFIGPPNPGEDGQDQGHEVNVRGRYVGTAKAGEVLEIPDELCAGTDDDPAPVWSAELWEDAGPAEEQDRPAPLSDAPAPPKKKASESEGEVR